MSSNIPSKRFSVSFFVVVALVLTVAVPVGAAVIDSTWEGGTGNWSSAGSWDPNGVPDNDGDNYRVYIDDGSPADSVVSLDMSVTIDSLTMSSGDTLNINNNRSLTIDAVDGLGTIDNVGLVALNSTSYYTWLYLGDDVTLSGGGVIQMSNSTLNQIRGTAGTERLINEDNTIEGAGNIGADAMALTNQDTIEANQTSSLTVDPEDTAGAINSGTMRATDGATLILNDGDFTNFDGRADGLVRADPNSTVLVQNSTLTGGQVEVASNGEVQLNSGTITGGTTTINPGGILRTTGGTSTLGGTVNNAAGGEVILNNYTNLIFEDTGTYNNAGLIALNSTSYYTRLYLGGGDVTLSGGGVIQMSNSSLDEIRGTTGTERLINENNTIEGAGNIGVDLMALTNQSLIDANLSTPLTIDPEDTAGAINTGTMQASGIGTLILQDGTFTNTGGLIQAVNDAEVHLKGVAIEGGTLSTSDNGVIYDYSSATLDGTGVLNNAGNFQVRNNTTATLIGTINNTGLIALNSTSYYTWLYLGDDVTLSGDGVIQMSNSTLNQIRGTAGTERLINEDNTIEGAGNIGVDLMALTNQGTIEANQTNTLTVDPEDTAGVINSGTMRATDGATLILNDGDFTNFDGRADGLVQVDPNSTVLIQNSTLTGGQVEVASNGEVQLNSGTITGGTTTINPGGILRTTGGTSTLGGTVNNAAGGEVILNNYTNLIFEDTGTYNNAGLIALNSTNYYTRLYLGGGDATLSGGGVIQMSNNTLNQIRGTTGTERLINENNTIEGAGNIGVDLMALTNQGVIDANVSNVLTIDPEDANGAINTGTMQASGIGTLILQDGTFTNTGGLIQAVNDAEVHLKGVAIEGGTLSTSDNGVIYDYSTATLDGTGVLNNAGDFQVRNNAAVTLIGTINNTGLIELNSTASYTRLYLAGDDVTLSGGGVIQMSNRTTNQIRGTTGTERLVNQDNTIEGAGNIGVDSMALTNQGVIDANVSNVLTIDPEDANGAINTGTMQASGIGTLILQDGTFTNTGATIQALDTGEVRLQSGAKIIEGTLATADSGTITNYNTATLDDVTLAEDTDYYQGNGTTTTLIGTITNGGTMTINSAGSWTYWYLSGGDVTLIGGGAVVMSNRITNRILGVAGTERLINQNNRIEGGGEILALMTNNGTIDANVSNALTFSTNEKVNDGVCVASNSGTLNVNVDVSGNGSWLADGGTIAINNADVTTTGNIDVLAGGFLDINNSSMTSGDLFLDNGARLDVASGVSIDGTFYMWLVDENNLDWSDTSVLEMSGGQSAAELPFPVPNDFCWAGWEGLEIGGEDIGAGQTFNNTNFDLANLEIVDGAHISLVDQYDNQEDGGLDNEALYTDTLFVGNGAWLNLNGLALYVDGVQVTIPGGQDYIIWSDGGGIIIDHPGFPCGGDCDGDGDVDVTDVRQFELCFTGPGGGPVGPDCVCVDFDGDGDVDCRDWTAMSRAWTGGFPKPVPEQCARKAPPGSMR